MRLKTIFLRILVASLITGALIGIFIFLFGEFGDIEIKLLLTTLAIGGFSLTGLCSSTIYGQPRLQPFSVLGMATAVAGFFITTAVIWELWEFDRTFQIIVDFIICSLAFAHISLLFHAEPKTLVVRAIRIATISCITIVAAMLIWATACEFENSNFYFRILGIFAILDVLGTILLPVLNKILTPK